MRLKGFNSFIANVMLKLHTLKDCTVIVDGLNLAHHLFKGSNLPHEFGCESDKIAKLVQDYLIMFKKANVKCCFIFKGGASDYKQKIQENKFSVQYTLLLFETLRQTIEEMDIDYTICEFAAKRECIAAAQTFNCPLISFDIEYCFSNVAYIPHNTLKYNNVKECIECGVFELKNLYNKYQITKEKLSVIIGLKDISLFPENTFDTFFAYMQLRAPYNYPKVYILLLQWLSNTTFDKAINQIFKCDFKYNNVTKEKFIEETQKVFNVIDRTIQGGIPVQYLHNGNDPQFQELDSDWFQKGVASNHIPIPGVDLYHSKIIRGFTFTENEAIDAKLVSIDIIKYTYDLLTNFQQEALEGFTLIKYFGELIKPTDEEEKILSEVKSIRKPMYEAVTNVFENGWNEIKELKLFEHFLKETVQFDFQRLESIPEDVKMLFISLFYFSRKNDGKYVRNIVYSVLFSHVILNTELDEENIENIKERYYKKIKSVIVDTKLQYNLSQYVICLDKLNNLNTLCGASYKPTIYRKVYNGTLIYNIFYALVNDHSGKELVFIEEILNNCPSVFTSFKNLVDMYNSLIG